MKEKESGYIYSVVQNPFFYYVKRKHKFNLFENNQKYNMKSSKIYIYEMLSFRLCTTKEKKELC